MNNITSTSEPKLAKPGAGLPFLEWAVAKYFLLPRLFSATSPQQAIDNFAKESNKILTLGRDLNFESFTTRRLVPRLRGLEDSSRYWSVAMVIEHLIIVGDLMRQVVLELSKGNTKLPLVGTAEVKPNVNVVASRVLQDFEIMTERFVEDTRAVDVDAFPQATHPHPWFGPLNARKWLTFAAPHEQIHRRQIKEIISRL